MKHILVTGGAGYIGSHTTLALLEAGLQVSVVDSLVNSSELVITRLRALSGRDFAFYHADLRDSGALESIFNQRRVDAVVHFAGLKAVGESVSQPLLYYDNNLSATMRLLECMRAHGCHCLAFSSSATVYGAAGTVPITEQEAVQPTNPYGHSKAMIERFLLDLQAAEPGWRIALLRYFNPVGAHPSGQIGEDPRGTPNNLMPYISQVAVGRRDYLQVFGSDYPTTDGSGVRDYIHVEDLSLGHLRALEYLQAQSSGLCTTFNLGTGQGYSVLEVIRAYERSTGVRIAYRLGARRAGDVALCYADPSYAQQALGWRARLSLEQMCASAHNWQLQNPEGYGSSSIASP